MGNQMITFSFRTTPEAVRKLRKEGRQRKVSCGALIREMLKQIKEEIHESKARENDPLGNDVGLGSGLQPDHRSGSRAVIKQSSKQEG